METEPDKLGYEDPPRINDATDLENLAINDSVNEPLSNLYEHMSDVSSVNSDEILQEYRNLDTTPPPMNGGVFEDGLPPPPPQPETVPGIYDYIIDPPEPDPNYVFVGNRDDMTAKWYPKNFAIDRESLGPTTSNMLKNDFVFDASHHNKNIATFSDDQLEKEFENFGINPNLGSKKERLQNLIAQKEDPTGDSQQFAANRRNQLDAIDEYQDLMNSVDNIEGLQQIHSMYKNDPVFNLPIKNTLSPEEKGLQGLKEANQARLSGQNVPQQPYPDNWNPQTNTRANRAWGAQNIANREAEIAQNEGRVSGLGNVAREAQAVEALPGSASRDLSAAERAGKWLSKFAARSLPIINLGLLGYGLYNQSKNNRENAHYRKVVEGNRI